MDNVIFQEDAERSLAKLSHDAQAAILGACRDIGDDWGIGKSLKGHLHKYRVHRVGVYRIIYRVKESRYIEIAAIGHRKDIYEQMR